MEQPWTYLRSTVYDWEADVIVGLLESNNIPVLRKYPGSSEITKLYTGSPFGVDLYVPAHQLGLATALLRQAEENTEKG